MPFTESELRALLARGEGQFIEFKSLWDRSAGAERPLDRRRARDLTAESLAAFANADGGTLVLGVEDDGAPTGHGYPEEALQHLLLVGERRLRPPLRVSTQRIVLEGRELLLFEVPNSPEAVMIEGDGFPYRIGDRNVLEPQEIINERKRAYWTVGYERRIRPEASLADVDLELVESSLGHAVASARSSEGLLERYGLVIPGSGSPGITNACLLLFGKAPLVRWHPRSGIRFFRVAGTERRHGIDRNVSQVARLELPVAAALPQAYLLARAQIRTSETLHNLFFRETPEYPEFAWQEALVNAFAHRDYEDQTREIEVWFFDDRMEITSPGVLVPPVTLDLLRRRQPVHASRNPLIVRVLADLGIMREEGEGIPRIFDEMERSFLRDPELLVDYGQFQVTLRNTPLFSGPAPEWQRMVASLPLGTAQRRILLAHPEGFTNEDFRTLNSMDRDQAYRSIQEMVSLGIVEPPASHGRGAIYRIAPNLHEARAFLNARLPGLRDHFAHHPTLRNSEYRGMFDLTRIAAGRELRRLVEEGYLRMEGERRGAHYLPTEALAVPRPQL
jgi:ATP-dependent DNA helicase RecG